jgi:cobalt-zinc-cadmium efflux system outer membrane protein
MTWPTPIPARPAFSSPALAKPILVILALAVLAPLTFSGCATVSNERVTADVSEAVSARLDETVDWNAGTPDDENIRTKVDQMLGDQLTIDEAVAIALINNRGLRATLERTGVARADLIQAGLLENPVFGFTSFNGNVGSVREYELFQELLSLFTLSARKNLAGKALEHARLEVGQSALDLTAEVKQTYYGLLADKQSIQLFTQVLDATEAAAVLASRQYRAGTMSLREKAMQQSFHSLSTLDGARAEAQFAVDREKLNRLLGLWGGQTNWVLPERLPDVPAEMPSGEAFEQRAMNERLGLAALRAEVENAYMALDYGRQTRWLSVFGIQYTVLREADGAYLRGPKIELSLPLFDRGQARMARLEAELSEAENRYAQLAIDVRSEVREAASRLSAAHGLLVHYRAAVLPLADQVVGETLKFYNGMLVGVYELLNAKQTQIRAASDYIGVWRDFWVAWTDLELAIGTHLPVPVATSDAPDETSESADTPAEHSEHQHGDH